jgi:adenylate cyclase
VGRYIRYWYTYRTVVAVLLAFVLTGSMFWLYTQQQACDRNSFDSSCRVNISVHPEDRLVGLSTPDPNIIIVGLDNKSVQELKRYPIPRNRYADALRNLQKAGAAVVAFDIGFPDPRDDNGDLLFSKALAESTIPVVLAYGGDNTIVGEGRLVQTGPTTDPRGIDQLPLRIFRCADGNPNPDAPCLKPFPNVVLASTDIRPDADGVVRRMAMFVQPACVADGACTTPIINPLSFTAYRAFSLGKDFQTGPTLQESGGTATFSTAWTQSLQVDSSGAAFINFTGPADNFKSHGQYISFSDVAGPGPIRMDLTNKIVLIGAYNLTGFQDEQLVPTSAGSNGRRMPGVEIHANAIQMFLQAVPLPGNPSKFLTQESPLLLFLSMLPLTLLMAIAVARVSVLWGLVATGVVLVAFTFAMGFLATNNSFVPDLFHPWLAIALTYSGVTAYRFLYEDREKRKVTALFGHYLKPEIVAQLAKTRGGVDDILRGGERRDITLLFVDVRGFTSMSERMEADDVVNVVQMYLDHLSGIIFTWDGTVDKYVGDEIVAFWNAPRYQENHALLAVRCAYDLINRAPELQAKLLAKGLPPIRWGIGVNSGPAVVGNMGSRSRLQYTALGDTVNTAARFCANAPAYHLLIGQGTYDMCKDYIAVDMVPGVQLKGKSAETFRIYQVTAIRETPTSPWVPFPTEMATEAQQTYTQQYTQLHVQQVVATPGESASREILVGEEAQQALADQAAVAPTPPYGTPTLPQGGVESGLLDRGGDQ